MMVVDITNEVAIIHSQLGNAIGPSYCRLFQRAHDLTERRAQIQATRKSLLNYIISATMPTWNLEVLDNVLAIVAWTFN